MTKREVLEKAISNASMLGSTYEDSAMTEESYQESYKVILDSALSELAQIEQAERLTVEELKEIIIDNGFAFNDTCGDGREITKYEVDPKELAQAIHEAQERKVER